MLCMNVSGVCFTRAKAEQIGAYCHLAASQWCWQIALQIIHGDKLHDERNDHRPALHLPGSQMKCMRVCR